MAAHTRTLKPKTPEAEALPFFDEARVPVEGVELPNPEFEGLTPEQYDIIGTKVSYQLAQRPGSWVVIKYVRPVAKRPDTEAISVPALPAGVIKGSRAMSASSPGCSWTSSPITSTSIASIKDCSMPASR